MAKFNIRPASPQKDFPALAELLDKVWPQTVTAENLHEWESRKPEGQIRLRYVVDEQEAGIIGYGLVYREASGAKERFLIDVIVNPDWRQQGIGSKLYDHVFNEAINRGATLLDCDVRENCPSCLRFAEKRGFIFDRHMFESVLNLSDFDYGRFTPLITQLQNEGLRFFSLAEGGDTAELRRQLYAIDRVSALDDPASKGTFLTYEQFCEQIFEASWFRAEGQIMAADGDEVIGLSSVGYFAPNNEMYNMSTGVMPAYRGRKIAQALKALALRYAQVYGADIVITHNDSQNAPMLAINRKFGYQSQPGEYRMVKRMNQN